MEPCDSLLVLCDVVVARALDPAERRHSLVFWRVCGRHRASWKKKDGRSVGMAKSDKLSLDTDHSPSLCCTVAIVQELCGSQLWVRCCGRQYLPW